MFDLLVKVVVDMIVFVMGVMLVIEVDEEGVLIDIGVVFDE